jgi:EmrB/QacA subfamily drug resistance transporter
MSVSSPAFSGGRSKNLVLTAMIFAVAMTFIDQTIVSIAAPKIQDDLGLSSSGMQWAINAYLLSLAALFAFGGRLADTVGHRKMVVLGVIIFAASSALCGLTPHGSLAETWIVAFRAVQGLGGAIMFPAALAIVVQTFELRSRGRALALFFGIAGGLTAIGPIAGGYLLEWTWRAIFWINVPVALIALALIAISKPVTEHRSAPMDYRGLALVVAGVGLSVFGLQQSSLWGWGNPAIEVCIVAGLLLLGVFVAVERRTSSPLMNVRIFRIQPFLVENIVLLIVMMVFIPVFFFASEYGQIALAEKATNASLLILYFFLGFVVFAQIGGRMLDRTGAKRPVVVGCVLSAVGFALWAGKATDLHAGSQVIYIVIAGAGMGLMLGQANTDAVNRASRFSYGEATGITQTVRNYGASLGFAILGTILLTEFRSRITASLVAKGLPQAAASAEAGKIAQLQGGSGNVAAIPAFLRADFASATREVLYVMAGIMAVAALVALGGLRRGVQEAPAAEASAKASAEASAKASAEASAKASAEASAGPGTDAGLAPSEAREG